MFENPQQQPPQSPPASPLNPVMPAPGMSPMGSMPPSQPAPAAPAQPQVHSMPERFRSSGGKSSGSKGTKGLVIALVIVVVIAGLAVAGIYVFNNVLSKNNSNLANSVVVNTANDNLNTVTNTVDNSNTNSTTNDNTNVGNTNSLTNETTNGNTNSVSNTNTLTNSNTNSSINNDPLPSTTDADADGLTDTEEAAYGTDAAVPDSDGDGFIDGKQVKSDGSITGELYLGYNPKGTGTLEAASIVKRVTNGTKAYSVLIPATWSATADSLGGLLITPSSSTSEFFKLGVIDNAARLSAKDWYQQTNLTADVTKLKTVAVNGLEGVVSEDGSTVYLVKDDKVYSLQYGTGSLSQVNYWTTFDMIQRSFKLGS